MIVRLLLYVFLGLWVWWLWNRLHWMAQRGPLPGGNSRGGKMVRDRVCNTFVPRESAFIATVRGKVHYFCSPRCRSLFLAR